MVDDEITAKELIELEKALTSELPEDDAVYIVPKSWLSKQAKKLNDEEELKLFKMFLDKLNG